MQTGEITGSFPDKRAQDRRQSNVRILFASIFIVAVLYLAKPVVVPVALAILFAFLLTPIVAFLERSFLRRTGAIVLSLGIAATSIGLGGYWIYQQFREVATQFAGAAKSGQIEEKLKFLRHSTGSIALVERMPQRASDSPGKPDRAEL